MDFRKIQSLNPLARAASLDHIVNLIHGDIYHCTICSSKFEEGKNPPRVLFCGDCLCENCLRASIAPSQAKQHIHAQKQIKCLVCH